MNAFFLENYRNFYQQITVLKHPQRNNAYKMNVIITFFLLGHMYAQCTHGVHLGLTETLCNRHGIAI